MVLKLTIKLEHRIETIGTKKLVGKRAKMSLADNKTADLWRSFMVRRKEIKNAVGTVLYSMQLLPVDYFSNFNPNAVFEKWAVTEVADFNTIPHEMEAFELTGGLYVVFLQKGDANTAPQTFQYIFGTWLPNSDYQEDDRPHFEILGEKYKNGDPNSEEEIWIPIKPKQ